MKCLFAFLAVEAVKKKNNLMPSCLNLAIKSQLVWRNKIDKQKVVDPS